MIIIALALAILLAPLAADAQERAKVARIGVLGLQTASSYAPFIEAFKQGLRELGYLEGQNLAMEYRWAEGRYERLPGLAADLVRLRVDVLVTHGTPGTHAAQQATTTIPIVMAAIGDAMLAGLVASLARPGGNITGSSFFSPELYAKRLELLKEAVPRIGRAALLMNSANPSIDVNFKELERTARFLGIKLQRASIRRGDELDSAFSALVKARSDGVVIQDDPTFTAQAKHIADLAARHRLPTAGQLNLAQAGGLLSYGTNIADLWRRAAIFVDKILKGARPADLPVEQAIKFTLVINLKTAKVLGLTIPQSVLVRADQVIE